MKLALHLLGVFVLALAPRVAVAALDPAAADTTVQTAVREGSYGFCTKPPHPLSMHARDLCPLATAAVGCEALVKECVDKPLVDKPSPFWKKLEGLLLAIAPSIAWTLVGTLLLLAVYLIVRAVRSARDDVVSSYVASSEDVVVLPDAPPDEVATRAELLLRRALSLHTQGDLRGALFTYLAAALRALDERGAIRIAKDRTNGEYVRACREAPSRPPLRQIVHDVDVVQFGGDDATSDAVARARGHAEAIVRTPPEGARVGIGVTGMLAALVIGFVSGCGGESGGRNDPSGRDLLADVLTKQGAHVKKLGGSLAALPMKGASGPVVIVDTERVRMEDETRAHLALWVKQGGKLVIAGNPRDWPEDFWAKPMVSTGTAASVETRGARASAKTVRVDHATLATSAAMTWPSEDKSPRALAQLEGGELYAALRDFGDGKILGLASDDLLTNLGLVVPGNAASVVALLSTLDANEFAVARNEQGVAPPDSPFSGLLKIGLGLALVHALVFIPLLFLAFGTRQVAPRVEPPARRRAFAEHVRAVGALYARRREAPHALRVFAHHVDDRLRSRMPRGMDPAQFLAMRSGEPVAETTALYTRAMASAPGAKPTGDELRVLEQLSALYSKAMEGS